MPKYKLEDITIGYNDGKKEAEYISNFHKYYYNYNNIYESILKKEKFLLLGRKGTGKSFLAEYIQKKAEFKENNYVKISDFKELKLKEFIYFKSEETSPNEFIAIWEWLILIEIALMIIEKEPIRFNFKFQVKISKLKRFIKSNFKNLKLNTNDIVKTTKKASFKGGIFNSLNGSASILDESNKGSYLNYINDLKEVIFYLLKKSNMEYTLILDELDDKFKNDKNYKNIIISAIKIVDKLNMNFSKNKLKIKVIILLRSDIFSILNDSNLNKIKQDNSIEIEWGTSSRIRKYEPLMKMITNRIKNSIPELAKVTHNDIYDMFFKEKIQVGYNNGLSPEIFLLQRSFFRPRDIITYLKFIKEKYPNGHHFRNDYIIDLEIKYSEYFLDELRNELKGHLKDKEIEEGFSLLRQFHKKHFSYEEIKQYYQKNKERYASLNLDLILKTFFKFGAIGNSWYVKGKDKYKYCYSYIDKRAEINFSKDFTLHMGLNKVLKLD